MSGKVRSKAIVRIQRKPHSQCRYITREYKLAAGQNTCLVSFSNRKQHLDSADKFDLGSWNAIVKFVWFVCKNHATSQSPD